MRAKHARLYGKDYAYTTNVKRWNWATAIRKRYGLSVTDYAWMLHGQDFKCAICGADDGTLDVDHCHETGEVRGMLCRSCNTKAAATPIGQLVRAIEYLARNQQDLPPEAERILRQHRWKLYAR